MLEWNIGVQWSQILEWAGNSNAGHSFAPSITDDNEIGNIDCSFEPGYITRCE